LRKALNCKDVRFDNQAYNLNRGQKIDSKGKKKLSSRRGNFSFGD
jgi:hypothetical protein